MQRSTLRFGVTRAAGLGLLGMLCSATPAPAAATYVTTTYDGSICHAGDYNAQGLTYAKQGLLYSNATGVFCPILRLNPTWKRVTVAVYLGTLDGSIDETSKINCDLQEPRQTPNAGTAVGGGSITGVSPQNPLVVDLTVTPSTGEASTFWTSMTSATPQWRTAVVNCDPFPANVGVRSLVVAESSQ